MAGDDYKPTFRFKQFGLTDRHCGMKIGTDGVLIGSWALPSTPPKVILDAGAGCGLIGLMLAQRFPDAEVFFSENDAGALIDLQYNISRSPFAGRCHVAAGDFRLCRPENVDLLVSNPPFFTTGEKAPEGARAAARHVGEMSPVSVIDYAAEVLSPRGVVALIIPVELLDAVEERAAFRHLNPGRVCRVATVENHTASRVMVEFTPSRAVVRSSQLIIRHADGGFTDDLVRLTRDFYLKM